MGLTVSFQGGFKDGAEIIDTQEAWAFYFATDEGVVGRRIKGLSDAGISELDEIIYVENGVPKLRREPSMNPNHVYEVVESRDDGVDRLVVFEYKGPV